MSGWHSGEGTTRSARHQPRCIAPTLGVQHLGIRQIRVTDMIGRLLRARQSLYESSRTIAVTKICAFGVKSSIRRADGVPGDGELLPGCLNKALHQS
jgi:hypothetical protein